MPLWTGNPSEIAPLLDSSVRIHGRDESAIDIIDHQIPLLRPQRGSDATSLHFLRCLRRLVDELQPYQALYLAGLSILESIIVARVGKVAGSFYQIFLDQKTTALFSAIIHAGFLYAACVATSAAGVWLAGQLAVQWRSHLTHLLHRRYCSNIAAFTLPSSPLSQIDNPDQRITAETASLCDALASAARLAAGAPFRVFYYSFVAWEYLGFRGVFTAFLFFIIFGLMQKVVVLPLARRVVVQEKKEGNLRFRHLQLRERGADIAACRGAAAELHALDSSLQAALENQKAVVNWRTAVTAATKGTDYSGALLNYALVGAAVFSGAAAAASGSGGELAQFVSNASFASLSLIYSFTEMLDLGEQLSNLAALTARVVGLLEAFPAVDDSSSTLGFKQKINNSANQLLQVNNSNISYSIHNKSQGQEMHPSGFATLLCPPTSAFFLGESVSMELSIHSLGRDLQNEVHSIFPESIKGSIHQHQQEKQVLCVLTFQFAGGGQIDLSPDRSSPTLTIAAAEMDRLLENYMRWEAALRTALVAANKSRKNQESNLRNRGEEGGTREDVEDFWCDSVDPRTGMPLHGNPSASNQRWSEVAAARALLHYDRRDAGVCPLVVHPVHGTSAYPVSFFTNVSKEVLFEALSSLAVVQGREEDDNEEKIGGDNGSTRGSGSKKALFPFSKSIFSNLNTTNTFSTMNSGQLALLSTQNLSFSTPDKRKPLVSNLSFSLDPGQWLLISGPNGAGKSTLLRALSGVHPLTAGTIAYNLKNRTNSHTTTTRNNNNNNSSDDFADPTVAMLLPQRPLPAPGPALWQQIAYPGTNRPSDHVLRSILNDVGLRHLLELTGGNLDASEPEPASTSTNTTTSDYISTTGSRFSNIDNFVLISQEEKQENWSHTLSPGEFQRLALARVLYHRPQVALLDEPCSAMDDTSAKKLLELVRSAGVTCITVAQDTAVYREMHAAHLKL